MKRKTGRLALLVLITCTALAGCSMLPPVSVVPDDSIEEQLPPEQPVTLSIVCVGDIMVHEPQLKAQYDQQSGTYDFDNNFQYVEQYIQQADLALGNIETTFSGEPYKGYPVFRSPDSLAATLKDVGFDIALTSNNHILDGGLKGLKRTSEVLRGEGLLVSGFRQLEEKPYVITTVKGVKVAILSYTYETPPLEGQHALNGNPISTEALPLINSFLYEALDAEYQEMSQMIQSAKADGAQLIIFYFHWGEEYQREPNQWQVEIAQKLSDLGADIVFASHPHVLQPYEIVESPSTGKHTAVFYSMGNFLSNQRTETLDNRYTEQGMIAQVELKLMASTGEILSIQQDAVPTWVDKYKENGKNVYAIVPLVDGLEDNPALEVSGHVDRAQQALEDVNGLLTTD